MQGDSEINLLRFISKYLAQTNVTYGYKESLEITRECSTDPFFRVVRTLILVDCFIIHVRHVCDIKEKITIASERQ